MSKSNVVVQLLLRALLVGAAVLGLFSAAQAQGRIGVTQATQNNPIAKETNAAVGRPNHSRVLTIQRSML